MRASDIMTPAPTVVTVDATAADVAAVMRDHDVGFVPVVDSPESMRLRGVVTDRDLAIRCIATRVSYGDAVRRFMTTTHLATVPPDAEVHQVLLLMERAQVRRVPVVDSDGRVIGVIGQSDLARRIGAGEPWAIEELIERISEPSMAMRPHVPVTVRGIPGSPLPS